MAVWLSRVGAQVTGLALPPQTTPDLFTKARVGELVDSRFGDIRDVATVREAVRQARPEIVLHLAAQALVRASYAQPVETFATNVMGTAHVLDSLRGVDGVRVAVVVTTDKVYRNLEHPYPYREDDALGGHDPYSASKAAAELVVSSYRDSFLREQGIALATARAGNVIGGGDWSADRLIPDAVRAWRAGEVLHVRRPQAYRPWQHVLEPLAAYLRLAESLWRDASKAGAYNFGPWTSEAASVREVVEMARAGYGAGQWQAGDGSEGPHEAGWLALEIVKARHMLGVAPRWNLSTAVERTMAWYRRSDDGNDARSLCEADISAWEEQA